MSSLGAVVLCGGKSRRMGSPKAWLPFGGETLLQRIVRVLGEVASPIVVVAAPGQEIPPLPPDILIARDPISDRGPLQGIAAGLSVLAPLADAAFVSSTDAPFLDPALVRRLVALRGNRYDVAVPHASGHYHPLSAVYATSVRTEIEALLGAGRLRPFFLFERVPTLFVTAEMLLEDPELAARDPELRSLRNLNTPEDYAAALRDAHTLPVTPDEDPSP